MILNNLISELHLNATWRVSNSVCVLREAGNNSFHTHTQTKTHTYSVYLHRCTHTRTHTDTHTQTYTQRVWTVKLQYCHISCRTGSLRTTRRHTHCRVCIADPAVIPHRNTEKIQSILLCLPPPFFSFILSCSLSSPSLLPLTSPLHTPPIPLFFLSLC